MNTDKLFAREWYRTVPNINSRAFATFAATAGELSIALQKNRHFKAIRNPLLCTTIKYPMIVIDNASETAYALHSYRDVKYALPSRLFVSGYYKKFPSEIHTLLALTLINHATLHETAHLATLENLKAIVELDPRNKKYLSYRQMLYKLANIIEDLFIEFFVTKCEVLGYEFIIDGNDFYFTDETCDELLKDNKELMSILIAILLYKNEHLRERIDAFLDDSTLTRMIQRSLSLTITQEQRAALVFDIFEYIVKDKPEDEKQQCESQCNSNAGSGPVTAIDKSDGLLPGAMGSEVSAAEIKAHSSIIKEFMQHAVIKNQHDEIQPVVLYDCKTFPRGTSQVVPSATLRSIGPILNRLRTFTNTSMKALPTTCGTRISSRHLHRIVTDNKVLLTTMEHYKPHVSVEIIFVDDVSGSTVGSHDYSSDQSLRDKIYSASLGAMLSLKETDIYAMCFAHTSARESKEGPGLYLICDTNNSILEMRELFSRAQTSIRNSENYDGLALLEASKHFKKHNSRKFIFHLSDGVPAGSGYGGNKAIEHVKAVNAQLRKKGIIVISLSLVEHVIESNNAIYGKDNNIDARQLDNALARLIFSSIQ